MPSASMGPNVQQTAWLTQQQRSETNQCLVVCISELCGIHGMRQLQPCRGSCYLDRICGSVVAAGCFEAFLCLSGFEAGGYHID